MVVNKVGIGEGSFWVDEVGNEMWKEELVGWDLKVNEKW